MCTVCHLSSLLQSLQNSHTPPSFRSFRAILPCTSPEIKATKVFSSAINFLIVALNQPAPSILFSFKLKKFQHYTRFTTPNIQQSPGIAVFFPSPALSGRVMDMTCNTVHTERFNLEALRESLTTNSDPSSQASPSSCFLLGVSCGAHAGMHLQLQVLLPLISAQTARAVARGAPENRNAGRITDTQQGCCSRVYSYFKENCCCLILYMRTGPEPVICCIPS